MAELQKILESQEAFQNNNLEQLLQNFSDQVKITNNTTTTISNGTNRNANLNTNTQSNTPCINSNDHIIMDNGHKTTTTNASTNMNSNINHNLNGASNTCVNSTSVNANANNRNVNINKQEFKQFFYVDPRANRLSNVQEALLKAKTAPSDARRVLLDQITESTTENHMNTTLNTETNIREANERIANQQGIPAGMPDMSKMMNMDPGMMMKMFLNSMVPEMTKVVQFAKRLPGFESLDLDTDDQLRLIRQGMFEVMVARITLLIDNSSDTMLDPSLKMKKPRAAVRKMSPLGPFIDSFFDLAKETNPLNLTDGENGLFGAILMLCPDRTGLKDTESIRILQDLYVQALYMLMKKNHKDAEDRFTYLLSCITSIRKINDDHFKFIQGIKLKSPSDFESHFPDLHKEIFDVSTH